MNSTRPFDDDDVNEEIKNLRALGLLESDGAVGLNIPFDDDDVNEEIKYLRALGLLESDGAVGLNIPFDDDDVNEEIKNLRALGLLESDRAVGLNIPFDDDDVNEEIENLRALGLLESDGAVGLNMPFDDDDVNEEIENMRALGLFEAREGADSMNARKPQKLHGKRNKKFTLKRLNPEDPAFKQISANLKNIRPIQSIQIVTNEQQQKKFEMEQNLLKDNDNDFNLNVKYLYHGTVASKDIICNSGLDLRLSRQGMFGKGIYFSDNVKKCEKYLSKANGGSIYVCSVILGDMKEYPDGVPDTKLKTEPKKPNGEIYHSVKGNIDGYNEYVVYENRRSLIKYRIVMEKDDDDDDEDENDEEKEPHDDETDKLDDASNSILRQFLERTNCDDEEFANIIIKGQNFDLENSVNHYQAMMEN